MRIMRKELRPLVLAGIFGFSGESLFAAFLPLLGGSFTSDPLAIAILSTLYYLALSVFGPFWGSLSDILRRRKPFIQIGMLGYGVTIVLCGFTGFISQLLILRIIAGISAACFIPIAFALTTDYSTPDLRGQNISLVSGSRSFGWMLGSLSGAVVGVLFDVRGAFLIGGLMVISGSFWVTWVKDRFSPVSSSSVSLLSSIRTALREVRYRLLTFFRPPSGHYLSQPGMSSLYKAVLLRNLGTLSIYSLISILFVSVAGPFPVMIIVSMLHLGNTLTQSISMPIMGRLADQFGRRNLIVLGALGSTLVLLIFTVANSFVLFFLGQVFTGIAYSSFDVGSRSYITDHTSTEIRGEALGFIDTARNLGAVFGTVIIGVISALLSIQQAIGMMSLFSFAGFLIVLRRIPKGAPPVQEIITSSS